MGELFTIIFGAYSIVQLIGFLLFYIFGYIVYGLIETSGRDKLSPNTPEKWNWKFWFKDNWRRYLTTILCSFILFRFSSEMSGHPFSNFDAVAFGLIGDGIAATLKERIKGFSANRVELMKTYAADKIKADNKEIANELKDEQEAVADELKDEQEVVADEVIADNKEIADDLRG